MTSKRKIKAIEAVGSKSLGTKRAVGDEEVKSPKKRQKTKLNPEVPIIPEEVQVQPCVVNPGQVFRFLDLPGELRNRIYEIAAERSHRFFPHTWPKGKVHRRGRSKSTSTSSSDEPSRRPEPKPIPYLGLSQVCTLIRTEFRPLWLSTHRFPLFALGGYLKAFFPPTLPHSADADLRKRIKGYYDPAGTLRLYINKDSFADTDILKVIKHKIRFPQYTIIPEAGPGVSEATLTSLSSFLNNDNPSWLKWIKGNVVKQVRLGRRVSPGAGPVRVVIKERCAPLWMRSVFESVPKKPKEYVASLGLDTSGWIVSFGVDYS